jgi:hypothetical protein
MCDEGQDVNDPLMVCFPPPGIVPIEIMESATVPWTVCPDHLRFAPTPDCHVQVFRVSIDVAQETADRIAEVPLDTFCVDCTDIGTSFCIIFTLAADLRAGDQFEVVVTGLSDRCQSEESLSELQYFISFESFRPPMSSVGSLHQRVAKLAADLAALHLWKEVAWHFPAIDKSQCGTGDTKAQLRNREAPFTSPQEGEERANIIKKFNAARPPPFGVVPHPSDSAEDRARGLCFLTEITGNEIFLAITVPSFVVVKASLIGFMQAHDKWQPLPRSVMVTSFRDVDDGNVAVPPGDLDGCFPSVRIVLRVFIPSPGKYEVILQWGFMPKDTTKFSKLDHVPTPHDHPLRFCLSTQPGTPAVLTLVPALYPAALKRFGYPQTHRLCEHFGVTLIGPMRYRLRVGFIQFMVYLHNGRVDVLKKAAANPQSSPLRSRGSNAKKTMPSLGGMAANTSAAEDLKPPAKTSLEARGTILPRDDTDTKSLHHHQHCIQEILSKHARCGSDGTVCVAVVVGDWQRVEMLDRRPLKPPKLEGTPIENQPACSSNGGSHACIGVAVGETALLAEPFEDAEVHELTVRLTHEDRDLPVRLFVLDCRGLDEAPQNLAPQTLRLPAGIAEQPKMWCLAEYVVGGTRPVPYDEDQIT